MTYQTNDYKNYLEKLAEIKEYDWVKNHLQLKEVPNFWTILEYGEETQYGKRSAHEIRTSRMIRWLVDANETHQLGNVFSHKLMEVIGEKYAYKPGKNKASKATAEEMDIDVLYRDNEEQILLAIELKQYAEEGKYEDGTSQLDKYEGLIKGLIDGADRPLEPHYIYLTPQADDPSNDKWHPVGYQTLIDIIEDVEANYLRQSSDTYAADTRKIILDFKDDLVRSMDHTAKKNNRIHQLLSDKEKKLTRDLANEIEHAINTTYLDQLIEFDQGNISDLKEVILIANDHIYTQDHSPNDRIRVLIRKIYNYLSADKQLNIVDLQNENKAASMTPIKSDLREAFGLTVDRVQITGGKGQGLYLINEDDRFQIYLSGQANGDFPNDYIHLLPMPNEDKERADGKHVPNRLFNLNNDLIYEDKIQYRKQDKTITFEQFMTDYILEAVKELTDGGLDLLT